LDPTVAAADAPGACRSLADAIANKASLSKPADLNPPAAKQAEFEKKFGISWKKALADGVVYNAVDACARLGIDGDTMDKTWALAKKSDNLVKFGGGFYAGTNHHSSCGLCHSRTLCRC
jgi:hypothetical protein